MTKQKIYTYLGTNGTITSPVHLEDIYSIVKVRLCAEKGKMLTNGDRQVGSIIVPEDEV
jgi:allophanate hydrolase subunit 2